MPAAGYSATAPSYKIAGAGAPVKSVFKGNVMTGDQQKRQAKELLEAATRGDVVAAEAMISDDFKLELMQRVPITLADGTPLPTVYDKNAYLGFVKQAGGTTKDGIHLTFDFAISDGPDVAVFGESNAVTLTGKIYANAYCWHFRFAGDKIALFREYCDTHLVRTVLFG